MPRRKPSYNDIVRNRYGRQVSKTPSPIKLNSTTATVAKRNYRHKSGVVANMEIRRLQKTTEPCIPLASFSKLIKELVQNNYDRPNMVYRMTKGALLALRTSVEEFLIKLFQDCQLAAKHRQRKTISPKVSNWYYK